MKQVYILFYMYDNNLICQMCDEWRDGEPKLVSSWVAS